MQIQKITNFVVSNLCFDAPNKKIVADILAIVLQSNLAIVLNLIFILRCCPEIPIDSSFKTKNID